MVVKQYEKTTSLKRLTTYFPCVSSHLLSHLIQLDIHTHNLMILLHRNGCILRCLGCKDLKLKKDVENIRKQYFERKGHKLSLVFIWLLCRVRIVDKCGEENQRTQGKPSRQDENHQQTQPTYVTGPESNPGHIGGIEASALTTAPSQLQTNDSREGDRYY